MRQMKDSGIEWIGEIPEGLEVRKVKKIFSIVNGSTPKSNYSDFWDGDIIWVTPAEMSDDIYIIDNSKRKLTTLGYTSCGTTLVPKNSILISSRAPIGQVALAGNELCTNQGCKALVSNDEISEKFFCYFFKIQSSALNSLGKGTTFLELSSSELGNFIVPYPPLEEQQRIADYLDAKCAYIDQCLELTRQSMEKLRAYKLSCITEAVTKGLDPDVPLKDSGVPWIGKICEHYEIIKIKYFTDIIRGKFSHRPRNDPRFYNGEYPFIQTGDIKISNKYITKYSQTLNDNGFNISRQFPSGTIVMAIAANVGDVAILDFDACFPDSVIGFTNLININKLFFYYTLITLKQVFIEKSTISTQLNLNIEIVNEVKIPYPPLPEQERIAAYLDKKCARIDALLEEKQALLDKLAEYKKSLIFECVTGKREVPSCWNR